MKKRFRIMNAIVLVLILIAFASILATGDHYDLHTRSYFRPDCEIKSLEMRTDPIGILSLDSYELDPEGQLVIHLSSFRSGVTSASFRYTIDYPDGESVDGEYSGFLEVNRLGVIVERSYGKNFSGFRIVIWCILAILLVLIVFMLSAVRSCWKQGAFSYLMVACGGVAIFASGLLFFSVYKLLNNVVNDFATFLSIVYHIGVQLLLFLSPVMFLMALALAVSNLWLIRHEGFRPVNLLGIVFAILWGLSTIYTLGYNYFPSFGQFSDSLRYAFLYVCCYFECMFLSTSACAFLASKFRPPLDKDYILILGCGIRKDGTLTPLLRGRVDSALRFEQRQYEATGRHAVFIPSGGQGPDECVSEAEAMERYLLEQGVPAERILREDRSADTFQNMAFSKAVIEADGGLAGKKIAFATTNFHVFRGCILARKCGFEAQGISAKTKLYFYLNAFLREFVGLLVDRLWQNLVCVLLTVLFFISLQLL